MTFELFQQGPGVYIPILLFSLIITILSYGAFPFIFARVRKTPVTKKKYRWLCYGINFAVMFLFIVFNGESNGSPYLLWTWLFSRNGIKVLEERGLLQGSNYFTEQYQSNTMDEAPVPAGGWRCSCGRAHAKYESSCVCGKNKSESQKCITTEVTNDKILFCRKCGTRLIEGSLSCSKCGTEVIKEWKG